MSAFIVSHTYHYKRGAVRWRLCPPDIDPRAYRPHKGWLAFAELLDLHPITERELDQSQWWIREVFMGDDA